MQELVIETAAGAPGGAPAVNRAEALIGLLVSITHEGLGGIEDAVAESGEALGIARATRIASLAPAASSAAASYSVPIRPGGQ